MAEKPLRKVTPTPHAQAAEAAAGGGHREVLGHSQARPGDGQARTGRSYSHRHPGWRTGLGDRARHTDEPASEGGCQRKGRCTTD